MKNNKWIVFVLIILIILGFVFLKPETKKKIATQTSQSSEDSLEEVPKEVKIKKPVEVKIISPKEETFIPGQARMWSAEIENFESEYGNFGFCDWKFYLNENNKESLYKEQTIRTVLSSTGENTCAFTSTFIESRGKLRAEVTVRVTDFQENLIETYKADRNYIVQ